MIALLASNGSRGVPFLVITSPAPAAASESAHAMTACRSDTGMPSWRARALIAAHTRRLPA